MLSACDVPLIDNFEKSEMGAWDKGSSIGLAATLPLGGALDGGGFENPVTGTWDEGPLDGSLAKPAAVPLGCSAGIFCDEDPLGGGIEKPVVVPLGVPLGGCFEKPVEAPCLASVAFSAEKRSQ